MTPVVFLRNAPPYMAGEVAGFPEEQAHRLAAAGTVRLAEPAAAEPEVAEPAAAEPAKRARKG